MLTDRGIHPDLLDEETAAAPEVAPAPPRGRRSSRAEVAASAPPTPETSAETAEPDSEPAPPETEPEAPPTPEAAEWWQQVKDAPDPKAALALLVKNLPKQELEQDPTLQGWIGDMGARRARAMQQQAEQERLEQQKREAAAKGDYYSLGELAASELSAQQRQAQVAQQAAPFMDGVVAFQSKLPPEIQAEVQGKTFGAGKSYAEGVSEYLDAITQAAVSHRLNEAVEREIKRREPALRKVVLSETNGSVPTPELDGGPAPSSREITDEQIAAMSLEEYDALFDANGRPKPGTRVRLTRAIDTRRQR